MLLASKLALGRGPLGKLLHYRVVTPEIGRVPHRTLFPNRRHFLIEQNPGHLIAKNSLSDVGASSRGTDRVTCQSLPRFSCIGPTTVLPGASWKLMVEEMSNNSDT